MISPDRSSRERSRGFSLIELLIAIFILGVGAISIAALFPAGIAQQRRTVDEGVGPIVAAQALSTLRAKLDASDFGAFDDFGVYPPRPTVSGDWPWLRPSFIFADDLTTNEVDEAGAIDIFSSGWFGSGALGESDVPKATEFHAFHASGYQDEGGPSVPQLAGIPYSRWKYDSNAPRIVFTQRERYYPQAPEPSPGLNAAPDQRPQYVWDCMFRRFQGSIQVAIFVYRAVPSGGAAATTPYVVPSNPVKPMEPPVPVRIALDGLGEATPYYWHGPMNGPVPERAWDVFGCDFKINTADDVIVFGSDCDAGYDPLDPRQSWQEPGQWILDQNNNVHRVLSSYCSEDELQDCLPVVQRLRRVELVRPIPHVPGANVPGRAIPIWYWLDIVQSNDPLDVGFENVVSDIWYVPTFLRDAAGREWELTPVYLSVTEL